MWPRALTGTAAFGRDLAAAFFTLLLVLPVWAHQEAKEPASALDAVRYKGKPTEFWIKKLEDKDAAVRKEAVEALGKIGPEAHIAVPVLVKTLEDDSSAVREGAIQALGSIGPKAKAALPALVRAIQDKHPPYRNFAIQAIGLIGPEDELIMPALVKTLLAEDKEGTHYHALEALRRIGPKGKAGIPLLREGLKAEDVATREAAVKGLGFMGVDAVPLLMEALNDKASAIRTSAAVGLGQIGPEAKAAIPVLAELIRDPFMGRNAASALGAIGPEAFPVLLKALPDDRTGTVRTVLASLGPRAKEAVPALIKLLKSKDANVVRDARDVLSALRTVAVPALFEAAKDKENTEAAQLLMEIFVQSQPKDYVPDLIKMLKDPEPQLRKRAADLLRAIGPGATAAVPALKEAVQDKDANVRQAAGLALMLIKPGG